uniref:Uncharacterized protein n=1 Tax=Anas platyrhynchos platyrhynchos TaxID=8840 RepID=A0A493T6F0_ANAPP
SSNCPRKPRRHRVPAPAWGQAWINHCGPKTGKINPFGSEARALQSPSFAVVVAIDFGTTSSGYAFSFCSDPEAIHMMSAPVEGPCTDWEDWVTLSFPCPP